MRNKKKSRIPINSKSTGRKQQIKKCKKENCNGDPELVDFNIEGSLSNSRYIGKRCANPDCFLVKSWKEVNAEGN